MAGDGAADRVARLAIAAMVVLAAFWLNFRFVLVHFSNGGYLLDSGWFAWIMASGDPWLGSPKSVSGLSYFNYHLAPYLSVLSVTFHAAGIDRFTALALHQGTMFGLLTGSLIAIVLQHWSGLRSALLFAAAGLFMVLGDVILQVASFPHFEIAIPALCLLGTALWLRAHRAAGALAFLFACMVREDGGLYAAAFLFGIAALRPLDRRLLASAEAQLAAGAILVALVMFWVKSTFFAGYATFASNFSGHDWDHLSAAFVGRRLLALAADPHALAALVAALILVAASRLYLVFPLLLSPVIVAQLLAVRDQLGEFRDYYATPFVVIWTGLVIVAADRLRRGRGGWFEPGVLLVSALLGSGPFLFLVQLPAWLPVAAHAVATETTDLPRLAREAIAAAATAPGACATTGVATVIPDNFTPDQIVDPRSDLSACRTIFLFDHDLYYAALKPKLARWTPGPVIGGRIERYDQRP